MQAQRFSKTEIVDETNNTVRPEYGPTAFAEGSANYISEYTIRKLSKLGIFEGSVEDFSEEPDAISDGKHSEHAPQLPKFQIEKLNYGNSCDPYILECGLSLSH